MKVRDNFAYLNLWSMSFMIWVYKDVGMISRSKVIIFQIILQSQTGTQTTPPVVQSWQLHCQTLLRLKQVQVCRSIEPILMPASYKLLNTNTIRYLYRRTLFPLMLQCHHRRKTESVTIAQRPMNIPKRWADFSVYCTHAHLYFMHPSPLLLFFYLGVFL